MIQLSKYTTGLLLFALLACGRKPPSGEWRYAGGTPGQTKYAPFDQINRSNVSKLVVAWTYRSGNMSGNVQGSPLMANGKLYVITPAQELVALDAATGKELWKFNPARKGEQFGGVNRGAAYWSDGQAAFVYYTAGSYLCAVNAQNGQPAPDFGDSGRISLNEGLVKPPGEMGIISPAAPAVAGDVVIAGAMTWSAPANVSAFDVRTGKRRWIFHCIPHPGEDGYESWGDTTSWRTGIGVNVWGGISVDTENNMVFFATGQPKDDFYRPDNKGAQLFGNCIVALDARTGRKRWHYQAIHHDLWDLDLPCAPILTELRIGGKKVPGVAQLSKTGNTFLFNRLTGELLSDVEERPAPSSPLYGEHASPTQPYVRRPEPFTRQVMTSADLTRLDTAAYRHARERLLASDTGWFAPPSERGVIYFGIHGGAEWGGGAYDPDKNLLFVNANELAWHITMRNINGGTSVSAGKGAFLSGGCASCHGANGEGTGSTPSLQNLGAKYTVNEIVTIIRKGRKAMPAFTQIPEDDVRQIARYLAGAGGNKGKETARPVFRSLAYTKFLDQRGYPAITPPWGTLNAINLTTGKIEWKTPLGEYPELTAQGVPQTGTENFGGCIVTRGGLVFVGASRDEKFRAFDKDNGKMLWETKLPYGGFAIPATYMVNGRQYVVIAATGGGKLGTTTGDAWVAFALPE
ncbi:outer membrane protein assembly factor BamB family protein [Chitinophaga lutea]